MLKVTLFEDGRYKAEKVDASEAEGHMYSENVGGYWTGISGKPETNADVIFIDGDKKEYHLKRELNKRKKDINEELKKLRESRKAIEDVNKLILADKELFA